MEDFGKRLPPAQASCALMAKGDASDSSRQMTPRSFGCEEVKIKSPDEPGFLLKKARSGKIRPGP